MSVFPKSSPTGRTSSTHGAARRGAKHPCRRHRPYLSQRAFARVRYDCGTAFHSTAVSSEQYFSLQVFTGTSTPLHQNRSIASPAVWRFLPTRTCDVALRCGSSGAPTDQSQRDARVPAPSASALLREVVR